MNRNFEIVDRLISSGHTISAMESCTGGLFASTITDRSGASDILKGTFVTYSNEAKVKQGVPSEIIETYGVYSIETAEAMAAACARAYDSEIGIGITGSLGRKDPNNLDSVVGQVYYCIYYNGSNSSGLIDIPDHIMERHAMKQYVVDGILDKLDKNVLI